MPLYLGLDASTQHLTLQALDVDSDAPRLVFEHTTNFDRDLPAYGTRARHPAVGRSACRGRAAADVGGGARSRDGGVRAVAGSIVSRVAAVSGSAQQHGSVYLNATAGAGARLAQSRRGRWSMQIGGIFARPMSPVWLDTSTSDECREITAAMGGRGASSRVSPDRARSSASRARRFAGSRRRAPDGLRGARPASISSARFCVAARRPPTRRSIPATHRA